MKGPWSGQCLRADRLVELLSPLYKDVRIMPTNNGLIFFDKQGEAIGGLSFKGKGQIDWHGPEQPVPPLQSLIACPTTAIPSMTDHHRPALMNLSNTVASLSSRVDGLATKYETQRLATLEWGQVMARHEQWINDHLNRATALEAEHQPALKQHAMDELRAASAECNNSQSQPANLIPDSLVEKNSVTAQRAYWSRRRRSRTVVRRSPRRDP